MAGLWERIESGPPPLGPGAPAADRLAAFFAAVPDIAARNMALMSAYEHAMFGPQEAATARRANDVYDRWHAHVAGLVTAVRVDLDADLVAHILLGSLHSGPVRRLLASEGPARVTAAVDQLVTALLAG